MRIVEGEIPPFFIEAECAAAVHLFCSAVRQSSLGRTDISHRSRREAAAIVDITAGSEQRKVPRRLLIVREPVEHEQAVQSAGAFVKRTGEYIDHSSESVGTEEHTVRPAYDLDLFGVENVNLRALLIIPSLAFMALAVLGDRDALRREAPENRLPVHRPS